MVMLLARMRSMRHNIHSWIGLAVIVSRLGEDLSRLGRGSGACPLLALSGHLEGGRGSEGEGGPIAYW
jgi:hypothetical protein